MGKERSNRLFEVSLGGEMGTKGAAKCSPGGNGKGGRTDCRFGQLKDTEERKGVPDSGKA